MTLLCIVLFWIASFLVVYPYVLYPFFLYFFIRLGFKKGYKKVEVDPDNGVIDGNTPSVCILIAAYNEQDVIAQKIENSLQLDYSGTVEIIVISDGSTDDTSAIVKSYVMAHSNVKLIQMAKQSGKSAGLNAAVSEATSDFLVFTDANAMFRSDALSLLIGPFDDPSVGYTVGSALYLEEDVEAVNVSEGLYWRYELAIKKLESTFHSVVGGDGAIYAIRRHLYSPLEIFDISDFVNPLQIVAKGYRGEFVPDAKCFERGTAGFADEFRRKRRIVNRSWGAVRRNWSLFSWRKDLAFLFMLLSHKIIRWWSLPLILLALLSSLIVSIKTASVFYLSACAIIALTMVIGLFGSWLDRGNREMSKPIYLVYYFYLVSLAGMMGISDEMRGRRQSIWQPSR